VCVLDVAGLEGSQKFGLRKKYKLQLHERGNVAIGICKEDCRVNVIGSANCWN
jgi:hypothetical protein